MSSSSPSPSPSSSSSSSPSPSHSQLFPPSKLEPSPLMQRRTAKTSAFISPPTPGLPPSAILSSLDKPPSRLNQRTLGLPNRIWLILSLFLTVLFFTRLILPSHSSDAYYLRNHPSSYSSSLRPINYFNLSDPDTDAAQNPFPFCPTFGKGDVLAEKYGALAISKSWLHLGSGARVQQVIHKALLGQPVTISVIGGSVSSCHGAGDDPIAPECYPSRFFSWWNSLFPHPASELTNGAIRRTNSEYFSFCSVHHLPDYTDLVILELDTDDKPHVIFSIRDRRTLDNFELLVRSILLRPDSPAVVILGHFSPQVHEQTGFAGPDHWHSVVAQFYDLQSRTIPILHHFSPSISRYYVDPILANAAGHSVLADVLVAYIQSQVCVAWSAARGSGAALPIYYTLGAQAGTSPKDATGLFGGKGLRKGAPGAAAAVDGPDLPRPRAAAGHPVGLQEVSPACVSANDLVNPLPPSLFYGSGWHAHHPPQSSTPATSSGSHYWYSTLPTSRLRVPLTVGAGDIGIYYVREPRTVLGPEGGSTVECWVDDNYGGRVVIDNEGDSDQEEATLQMIDRSVARGSHYVECVLLGAEGSNVPPFKIIGVFTT
ncbi:hypothetical protein B0F90DRAFT_1818135 [Multifurca ochricompacta]|uniref:Capsular associated protein n=1 Tax=Multifurca ochricompacta TaxID=376703 RepID=A0AAD4M242_9AGAM|nr:hypothetical protein B0F90DRAFT_1818135 [Multifurca ochricompacta]